MGKLPIKEFTLGGVKWKVKADNKRMDDMDLFGLCESSRSLISIYTDKVNDDAVEMTVWHEVTHSILRSMDRLELNADEEFVQGLALLLHQFDKTRK